VANSVSSSVTVYTGNGSSRTLNRTITKGVGDPQSLAFDSSGQLYVGNILGSYYAGDVTVYAPGKSDPVETIKKNVTRPTGLIFDSSNNLYVLAGSHPEYNSNYSDGYVAVYAGKKRALQREVTIGIQIPFSETLGSSGYLNVANCPDFYSGGSVTVYAPGSKQVNRTITTGIACPEAVGFGP
jgi:hypothetical protein